MKKIVACENVVLSPRIVPLAEDLRRLLENWGSNPCRTEFQKKRWPRNKLTHAWLGDDDPDALLLPAEDGCDGKPVSSYKANSAERFWSNSTDHIFPHPRDMVRLGIFLNMAAYQQIRTSGIKVREDLEQLGPWIYRTLALALKTLWEHAFARQMEWPDKFAGPNLLHILKNEEAARACKSNFNPNTAELFDLFEEHGKLASVLGYNKDRFDTLVHEMILADLHLSANDGPDLLAFAQRSLKTQGLLLESTAEQEQDFWVAKCSWVELQEQLGDLLLRLEDRRLENANIRAKWLGIFGKEYLVLEKQAVRVQNLRLRLKLKRENPKLDPEQLEEAVANEEAEAKRKLDELVDEIGHPPPPPPNGDGNTTISDKEVAEYIRQCKKILRDLYFLIFEDCLKRHPSYQKLSDKQKDYLRGLWERVRKIKEDELNWPKCFLNHDHRPLWILELALCEAKTILANAGLDTEPKLMPQGETLKDQIAWLDKAIKNLESDMAALKSQLKLLIDDPDIKEKQATLECPEEKRQEMKKDMLKRAKEYEKEAAKLEHQLAALFHKSPGKKVTT